MNEPPTREEVFLAVRGCVADSLAIKESVIEPDSLLIAELGADSLDFLDFIFSLEKTFSIKLRRDELDQLLRADASEDQLTEQGYLLPEVVETLGEWIPRLRNADARETVTPQTVFSHITVESLVILVERRLAEMAG